MARESLWRKSVSQSSPYPSLEEDLFVDIAVVGAGITGLTSAYLLTKSGKKVAVIEKERVASGESGNTTAHLTEALDTRYYELISDFGLEGARLAASASRAAINAINVICQKEAIDCDWRTLPAYLYSESGHDADELGRELEAASRVGVKCEEATDLNLPFAVHGALRFDAQATFQPVRYLRALADRVVACGSYIYEKTPVLQIHEGEPCVLETPEGRVRAGKLIIAANVPINNRFSMHTKLAAYRTYAIAVEIPTATSIDALLWDTMDPYHYVRPARANQNGGGRQLLVIGGEDHKTGAKEHTEKCYKQLEIFARDHFQCEQIIDSWSGQIIEPVDGLPYIGCNPHSRDIYIATGFSGQGMTFGTFSGILLSDLIQARANEWETLFKPSRFKPIASAVPFLTENIDYAFHLLVDNLRDKHALSVSAVPPGEGKIIRIGRDAYAVYRDEQSRLHAISPVCSHLGCHVHWNRGEKTWDCPCHGSRFNTDGEVLNGPAVSPLQPVDIEARTELEHKRQGKNVPGEAA